MNRLLIGSRLGTFVVELPGDARYLATCRHLFEERVWAVAADPRRPERCLLSTDTGCWVSEDGAATWRPTDASPGYTVTSLAISPADGSWFAGTEPSYIFHSVDGGRTWEEWIGLREVPSRDTWFFPPRPWTHHVSTLAPHAEYPNVLLAGIELGGIMRTNDGGTRFSDHPVGIHRDCHLLIASPRSPDVVFLGAGEGVAVSRDQGITWENTDDGLLGRYVTALAVNAGEPEQVLVASSPSAGRAWYSDNAEARLYRLPCKDDRQPWELLSGRGGLPPSFSAPVVELVVSPDETETFLAVLGDGSIWRTDDGGDSWLRYAFEGEAPAAARVAAVIR